MVRFRKISISLRIFFFLFLCFVGYFLFNIKRSPSQEQIQIQATSTEYTNSDYGFIITLPLSWKGYLIVKDTWKAYSPNTQQRSAPGNSGPLLSIRNPLWSTSTPQQDIPIMVFTLAEWDLLTQDKIHIGAAPINPSELGRNAKYVFGLPARYNYAFPLGYEAVDKILQTKPLHGF
jgi:hypothetical protein